MNRGFFSICLYEPKNIKNLGVLLRSAFCFGANSIHLIGQRYKREVSDTTNTLKQIPFYSHKTFNDFYINKPYNCELVSVEVNGERELSKFSHPHRAIYIFGGEDRTLPQEVLEKSDYTVKLETSHCLNLAICVSIVMYSRNSS